MTDADKLATEREEASPGPEADGQPTDSAADEEEVVDAEVVDGGEDKS